MIGKYWEHFTHDGGVGVRGIGATIEEAFEQGGNLPWTCVITNPREVVPLEEIEIDCEAPDEELLLAEWLNKLINEMEMRRMSFSHFDVEINGHHLQAAALGEGIAGDRHKPAREVKSATRTKLRVRQDETGTWLAQCVVEV